jgi:integrase
MSIKFNDADKCFEVQYSKRHPITRQAVSMRRKGIKTKAEAQRVERELVVLVDRKIHQAVSPRWAHVVERYENECLHRGLGARTIENCVTTVRKHTPGWNDRTVDAITGLEVREVVSQAMASFSEHHRKNMLKHLKAIFAFAVEHGWVQRSPVPHMKFRLGDKLKGTLTEPQVRRFLEEAKHLGSSWYPHWAMAVYTGMRNGELFALTWDKVNIEDRLILVDAAWNNKDGFKSTKSGNDRMLEIAPGLLPVLIELKLQTGGSRFVLPRSNAWSKGEQARELRKFLVGLGLPGIRFHDLRATWATLLLCKGIEPIRVMKMGGWCDMKTMMFYVRKAGVDIRGMTDCLTLHNASREGAKVLAFGSRSGGPAANLDQEEA